MLVHTHSGTLSRWMVRTQLKSSRPKQNKPCSSNQIQQRFSKHLVYARHIIAKPQCRCYHSPESSRCIFKQIFITKVSTVANSLHSPINADIYWINQWLTVQDLLRKLATLDQKQLPINGNKTPRAYKTEVCLFLQHLIKENMSNVKIEEHMIWGSLRGYCVHFLTQSLISFPIIFFSFLVKKIYFPPDGGPAGASFAVESECLLLSLISYLCILRTNLQQKNQDFQQLK